MTLRNFFLLLAATVVIGILTGLFLANLAIAGDVAVAVEPDVVSVLDTFWSKLGGWLETAAKIIAGASIITAMTPTQSDDKIINLILRILNWASLNIFKNKNADDVK
jgi:hypothetical protein